MDWLPKIKARHLIAGHNAEKLAYQYLIKQGLRPIAKNYRCRFGEIDLIMRLQQMLVFIEVRYRESSEFGLPEETVSIAKQRKIIKTAEYFLLEKNISDQYPCRFDIVAIQGNMPNAKVNYGRMPNRRKNNGRIPNHKINWITDAFYSRA